MKVPTQPDKISNNAHLNLCFLIVEDNAFAAEIMSIYLERQGFNTDIAENGKIAFDMFSADPDRYDAIFMDLQMPIMNGYESTMMIRNNGCIQGANIPIIATTGETLTDLSKWGFTDALKKPFQMQELLPLIKKFLSK